MKHQIYMTACILLYGIFCLTGKAYSAKDLPFQIIVHAENPHKILDEKNLKKLFLKKTKSWPKFKKKVLPVDLPEKASVREIFSKIVLGKNVTSVITYWQKQVFGARGDMPKTVSSDQKVIEYVAKSLGAIGYISSSSKVSDTKVKVIEVKLKKKTMNDLSW